jgi:hypothetical protein
VITATTGLMSAERWVKDNGLLPGGFDQNRADERVRVHGSAESDASFNAGGDGVRFRVGVSPSAGPFTVTAELWFQPISYRWAQNLAEYDSFETDRFVGYYESMAVGSALVVAQSSVIVR